MPIPVPDKSVQGIIDVLNTITPGGSGGTQWAPDGIIELNYINSSGNNHLFAASIPSNSYISVHPVTFKYCSTSSFGSYLSYGWSEHQGVRFFSNYETAYYFFANNNGIDGGASGSLFGSINPVYQGIHSLVGGVYLLSQATTHIVFSCSNSRDYQDFIETSKPGDPTGTNVVLIINMKHATV